MDEMTDRIRTQNNKNPPTTDLWDMYRRSHHGGGGNQSVHDADNMYAVSDRVGGSGHPWHLRGIHRASMSGRLPTEFQPHGNHPLQPTGRKLVPASDAFGDGGRNESTGSEDATAGGSTFPADPTRKQQQKQEKGGGEEFVSDGTPTSERRTPRQAPPRTDGTPIFASINYQPTASMIFFGGSASDRPAVKVGDRRSGTVDGHELEFELVEAVNEKPATSRLERTTRTTIDVNVTRSPILFRSRLYLMQLSSTMLSFLYLTAFVVMNLIFALLYYIPDGKCCDDPEMTYSQVFDFSVQTLATIGYGGYWPRGMWANFLVVIQSCLGIMMSAIYTGLLFSQFQTPRAKLEFSDIMTMSNVNGMPCLQLRVGNADGDSNPLIDAEANLRFWYRLDYEDEVGQVQQVIHTEHVPLMSHRRDALTSIWTLRHCIDEHSPLFGMRLDEWPGSAISEFRVSIRATQQITNQTVTVQTVYEPADVLVGYRFRDQIQYDKATQTLINDYAYTNDIIPQAVWYPARKSTMTLP
jgi:inward rectifier potassium channel